VSIRNFIDGALTDAAGGETSAIVNPATGEEIDRAAASGPEDVDRAVRAARAAFDDWSTTTPATRSTALLALADALEEHVDEFATLEASSAGHPIESFKDDEMPAIADCLRFFAGAARCLEGKAAGEYLPDLTSIIRREAVGVVGQIAPWNYPLMMAAWKIGPSLAAGNTVILKPAPNTPATAVLMAELAAEVLPKGVLNVVCGGDDAGRSLVTTTRSTWCR